MDILTDYTSTNCAINKCLGKVVPFGTAYTNECYSCARMFSTRMDSWIGPIEFTNKCDKRIEK